MRHRLLALGSLFVLTTLATAAEKEGIDWERIKKGPPQELKEKAEQARLAVINLEVYETSKKEKFLGVFRGVFISEDGLALFPMHPMCIDKGLTFSVVDLSQKKSIQNLPQPVVLKVFEGTGMALLKFDHKPKKHLRLAKEPVPLGTWVAIVNTQDAAGPILGPVVMHREGAAGWMGQLKQKPENLPIYYTIAAREYPGARNIYQQGDPVINQQGELVASFNGTNNMADVSYRNAVPLHGYEALVKEAATKNERTALPLTGDMNPFNPVVLDPLYDEILKKFSELDMEGVEKACAQMLEKYPDSESLKELRTDMMAEGIRAQIRDGSATQQEVANQLLELELKKQLPEGAAAWQKGKHHLGIGSAYAFAGKKDKALEHLKIADEVDPSCVASYLIGVLYMQSGQAKLAEPYLRRAVEYEPSRAIYWLALSRHPDVDIEEAMRMQEHAELLADLFGMR